MDGINLRQENEHKSKEWKKTRKLAIEQLRKLADEIQDSEMKYRKGQVACSTAGIISGGLSIAGILGAPFTAGLSLGLTTGSLVVGGTSGIVGLTHYAIKSNQVRSRCEKAKTILERDKELFENLMELIKPMNDAGPNFETDIIVNPLRVSVNEICSASKHFMAFKAVQAKKINDAAEILNISKTTKELMSGSVKEMVLIIDDAGVVKFAKATSKVGKEAAAKGKASAKFVQIASKVALPIAIFGTVMDVLTLVENVDKINSGEVSEHAWQLNKVADELENQLQIYEEEMRNVQDEDDDVCFKQVKRRFVYN